MNQNKYCIAEYSRSQNKFHCDFLKVSLDRNLRIILNNQVNDWITIGIFETWEETQEFIKKFKKQLDLSKK